MNKPLCPYCRFTLAKMPTRKTSCPSCQEPIYFKYGPGEDKNEKRLMTQQEADEVDQAWRSQYDDYEAENMAVSCGVDLTILRTFVNESISSPSDVLYRGLQAYGVTLADPQRQSFIYHTLGNLALKRDELTAAKGFFKVSNFFEIDRLEGVKSFLDSNKLKLRIDSSRACPHCLANQDKAFDFALGRMVVEDLLDNCDYLKRGHHPCFSITY